MTFLPTLPDYDSYADISDNWLEETGGEEMCLAFFAHGNADGSNERHEHVSVDVPILEAITVDDGHGVKIYDRERARWFLGWEALCRIEDAHMNAGMPNDHSDWDKRYLAQIKNATRVLPALAAE